jgi:RNA polymerase II elongation factor ELL
MTEKALREKVPDISKDQLKQALQKVGNLDESIGKWELRKNYYKELDVWTYDYSPAGDRQRAIDNAVRQYDRMRLGVSEPEWDKLLVRSERGTGKCLSKIQAQIAQGPVARGPKINVQKAEDSGRDTPNGEDDVFTDKNVSKVKGENMTRSVSQPPMTKAKKVSEKENQAKRLLSKNPAKSVAKPAPKKASQPKASSKVLSSEFVNDSDEEDDYPVQTNPAPKPITKRSRPDDDLDTSDSSIPLSKKVKKDTPTTHRVSDASQSSRTTTTSSHYSSSSSKAKGNSPQKSSPLASSPPTNASDMENSSGDRSSSSESPARHLSIKNSQSPIQKKRHQKSSSVSSTGSSRYLKPEVTDLARRFKMFYPKYEALHRELLSMGDHRDKQKEKDLLEMHARLAGMKKDIEAGIVDVEPQRSD